MFKSQQGEVPGGTDPVTEGDVEQKHANKYTHTHTHAPVVS